MDDIFAAAQSILIAWSNVLDQEKLPNFREIIKTKAKQADITSDSTQTLLDSQRTKSSFDIILFDLINKRSTPTNTDLLNECFRLLRPNGYLFIFTEQSQAADRFKMCGFSACNPLDSNSCFLTENKDEDVQRVGKLWLCEKPSFDIGYSIPLRRTGVCLTRQISAHGKGVKTWTVEDDDASDDDHEFSPAFNLPAPKPLERLSSMKMSNV